MWDTETGKCLQVWKGHKDGVMSLQSLPATKQLISNSMDRTVKVWQLVEEERKNPEEGKEEGKVEGEQEAVMPCVKTFTGHEDYVYGSAMLTPDYVISSSQDRSLKIWRLIDA